MRPLDTYWYWYARVAAWILARALPRLALMVLLAAFVLPACGLAQWSLRPPPDSMALALSLVSIALGVLNSAAMLALVGAGVVATGADRGVGALFGALVLSLSGNEIPLRLFPSWAHTFLALQPFASVACCRRSASSRSRAWTCTGTCTRLACSYSRSRPASPCSAAS